MFIRTVETFIAAAGSTPKVFCFGHYEQTLVIEIIIKALAKTHIANLDTLEVTATSRNSQS